MATLIRMIRFSKCTSTFLWCITIHGSSASSKQ